MKPLKYDEARLVPLASDALIEKRVSELIGRANSRQLWLLFLDEEHVQLPLLIPIDALPPEPRPGDSTDVMAHVSDLMTDIGARELVLVWERYGPSALTPRDITWARSVHDAADARGVVVRAMLLSHRHGVRWMAQDDYRF